ncbi:hypothetical protein M8J75_004581 [Diaphorina citri]|nr:hypothetical protein M8J75_004581 [Diaphorina citri]
MIVQLTNFLILTQLSLIVQGESFNPEKHRNWRLLPAKDKCGLAGQQRIIGGYIVQLGAFPWIARIGFDMGEGRGRLSYNCGGSLISKYYVVTAAHCAVIPSIISSVRLGEHDANSDPDCSPDHRQCAPPVQDIRVVKVISHEHFSGEPNMRNDIALLRLERPPRLNAYVQPICLPYGPGMTRTHDKDDTIVAGWGLTEKKIPSHILLGVNQLVYDRYLCTAIYERNGISIDTNKGQLCVGGKVGKDSCNGDSGGPLMWMGSFDRSISARTYLLGIVSLGPSTCGMLRIPGVYTRTSYFLRWILDNMQE